MRKNTGPVEWSTKTPEEMIFDVESAMSLQCPSKANWLKYSLKLAKFLAAKDTTPEYLREVCVMLNNFLVCRGISCEDVFLGKFSPEDVYEATHITYYPDMSHEGFCIIDRDYYSSKPIHPLNLGFFVFKYENRVKLIQGYTDLAFFKRNRT